MPNIPNTKKSLTSDVLNAKKFGIDEQYHSKFRTNAKFSLIFFFSLLSHIYLITPVCLTHSLNPSSSLSLSSSLSKWSPAHNRSRQAPAFAASTKLRLILPCTESLFLFACLWLILGTGFWYEKWDCSSIGLLFWGGGDWWWFLQVVLGWFWVVIDGGGFVDLVGFDLVLGFDLSPLSLFLWLRGG